MHATGTDGRSVQSERSPDKESGVQESARWLARVTAPIARPLAGRRFFPLWAVLHHQGRKSGRAYAIPVAIAATDTHLYIPVPFGPGTQWVRNVLAAGGCVVRWKGRDIATTDAVLVDGGSAASAFSRFQRSAIRSMGMDTFVRLRRAASA